MNILKRVTQIIGESVLVTPSPENPTAAKDCRTPGTHLCILPWSSILGSLTALLFLCGPAMSQESNDGQHLNISSIRWATNATRLIVTCPDTFTNRLDVYVCTNIVTADWQLAATNLTINANHSLDWTGSLTNWVGKKCYVIVGNADLDSNGNGIPDAMEKLIYKTDPSVMDSDHDGLPDWWEYRYFGNPTNAVASADNDHDGWDNRTEYLRGGNPLAPIVPDTGNILQFEVLTPLR